MDALRRNLNVIADGVERDLTALSLSDSLGHIATSWNSLLDQVVEVRQHAESTHGVDSSNEALERFQSRALRQLLDRLPVGVLRCDRREQVLYVNAAGTQLLHAPAEALQGRQLNDVVGEQIAQPLIGAFRRGAMSESVDRQSGEGTNVTTLRFKLAPRMVDGNDTEIVLTIEDVTHVREAERARDNFLYHVTHELRTPLTNIHAYAETLSRPDFDDETTRKECYNVIISETRRLSNLVEDILSVSQLEVGSLRLDLADVDIVRLMRTVVQDNLGHADEKHIDLRLQLPPKAAKIRGDKQRLTVLIGNLVGNAIKYTPEGGRVDVVLEADGDLLRIVVGDNGLGISVEDQQHIFDKFYRATHEAVQSVSGTGLGLAISREIARLHGGDISVQSALGKGSSFAVQLPILPVDGAA
jgi:two-component system phosphate regulon sensor histidine kinase PhoR